MALRSLDKRSSICVPETHHADTKHGKPGNSYQQPVFGKPHHYLDVGLVPAASCVVRKKAPSSARVVVRKQDTDTLAGIRAVAIVVCPKEAQKQRSGRGHDGNVRE